MCFQTLQDTARSLAKWEIINEHTNASLKAAYFASLIVLETDVVKEHPQSQKHMQAAEWKVGLKSTCWHCILKPNTQRQKPMLLWLPGSQAVVKVSPDRMNLLDPPPPLGGDTG